MLPVAKYNFTTIKVSAVNRSFSERGRPDVSPDLTGGLAVANIFCQFNLTPHKIPGAPPGYLIIFIKQG